MGHQRRINMENENTQTETEVVETEKTYTEKELQSEVDRRVNQALNKIKKENSEKLKEAEKLARMNEQEKYEYELEQREKAIAEKEKQLNLAENKAEAMKVLNDRGLNAGLVDFIVSDNAEDMKANIDLLDKYFKASVKAEVEKRLQTKTPKRNLPLDETMDKEKFNKLTSSELMELKKNNPDLFYQMVNGGK